MESDKNIGLALSGGGARAIAFHLGCLRALNDRGILQRIEVISSVSGGSVIAALYAYTDCPFTEFENRILHLLRSGIDVKIASEFFHTSAWIKELHQYVTKFPISIKNRFLKRDVQLRRISYRTLSFIEALQKHVYGGKKLTDRRRDDVNTVINASELRTGTAFRFGSKESGSWRFGKIEKNEVSVAEAVALSAAYPLYLPSLDKNYDFSKLGSTDSKRVVLSDGGIFDNTGVSCMEPGRSSTYSTNVYSPEYIICCNAGYGMLSGEFIPFGMATRLNQVLTATMRKVQDATMKRLHQHREANLIKGFILPYLGQSDSALPFYWPDLVKREEVDYPTDFRPMKNRNIKKLSLRGEQLTRLLIDYYCPEL
jgi:NTE family protein